MVNFKIYLLILNLLYRTSMQEITNNTVTPLIKFIYCIVPNLLMMLMNMRTYTTLMLCITVFFLFADQNLLAPNLSAIAKDFEFTDSERDEKLGGYIAFGFFVVGGPVALLVGYFTDTVNRCLLFGHG
jgi:MFS family permease